MIYTGGGTGFAETDDTAAFANGLLDYEILLDYCGLRNGFESDDFFSNGLFAGLTSLILFVGANGGTASRNGETCALSEIDFYFSILGG